MDTESLSGSEKKPATLTRMLTVRLAHTVASQRNLDAWNEVWDSAGHRMAWKGSSIFQARLPVQRSAEKSLIT